MAEQRFVIDGRPVPKARPVVVRSNVYTPSRSEEEAAAWAIRAQRKETEQGGVHVEIDLHLGPGGRHGDIDNYAKLYLDALVKGGVATAPILTRVGFRRCARSGCIGSRSTPG